MASFLQQFIECDFAVGVTFYTDNYPGETQSARIVLPVQIENVISLTTIVDTGAPWCVFDPEALALLGINKANGYSPKEGLVIRGEKHYGMLVRVPVTLLADEGEDLTIEVTLFVPDQSASEVWNYPNFIGLQGCLNRLRFAIDPHENAFYFGPL